METKSAAELLQELHNKYLSEISSKIDEIEINLISLDKSDNFFQAVRQIHNMKGSAGTYGYMTVSAICHHMEDYMSQLDADNIIASDIDALLPYVDLLRQSTDSILQGIDDLSAIEQRLSELVKSSKDNYKVLIVDGSKSLPALIRNTITDPAIVIDSMVDGYQALGVVLFKRYNLLITSEEVGALNGHALIAGIRGSNSANKGMKIIYLKSRDNELFTNNEVDFYLPKGAPLASEISSIIDKLKH